MNNNGDLPERVKEALKGKLHGSDGITQKVMQYHEISSVEMSLVDHDVIREVRLAIIEMQNGGKYYTRYYLNTSGTNFRRIPKDNVNSLLRGHECNLDICYRRA